MTEATVGGEQHVLLVLECADCDEADLVTKVEHAPESSQTYAITNAHEMVRDEHREATGHDATLQQIVGVAEDIKLQYEQRTGWEGGA